MQLVGRNRKAASILIEPSLVAVLARDDVSRALFIRSVRVLSAEVTQARSSPRGSEGLAGPAERRLQRHQSPARAGRATRQGTRSQREGARIEGWPLACTACQAKCGQRRGNQPRTPPCGPVGGTAGAAAGKLHGLGTADDAAAWAKHTLPLKSTLTAPDAKSLETAFAVRIAGLSTEAPQETPDWARSPSATALPVSPDPESGLAGGRTGLASGSDRGDAPQRPPPSSRPTPRPQDNPAARQDAFLRCGAGISVGFLGLDPRRGTGGDQRSVATLYHCRGPWWRSAVCPASPISRALVANAAASMRSTSAKRTRRRGERGALGLGAADVRCGAEADVDRGRRSACAAR